jgi:hypothetical protein
MPASDKKYEEEGLVRMDIDLDFKTYAMLLILVEKSGYSLDEDSRQKSEGIRGVLTQGIVELCLKYVEENGIDKGNLQQNGLDKINQQAYIFANRALAMRKNEFPKEQIISTLQSKLPVYLKNSKIGKLLAKGIMEKFVAASTFSSIQRPKFTPRVKEELIQKGVYKYWFRPKARE